MSAQVREVTQYAASCAACHWLGDVYDDLVGETFAIEDMDAHNREFHMSAGWKPPKE